MLVSITHQGAVFEYIKGNVFVDAPHNLFVRHTYVELLSALSQYIVNSYPGTQGGVHALRISEPDRFGRFVLVGHPGIGKKNFLIYVLIERVLNKQATIYQFADGSVYYFGREGVCLLEPELAGAGDDQRRKRNNVIARNWSDRTIWFLSTGLLNENILREFNCGICIRVADKGEFHGPRTKLTPLGLEKRLYMDVWKWSEIQFVASSILNISAENMLNIFRLYSDYLCSPGILFDYNILNNSECDFDFLLCQVDEEVRESIFKGLQYYLNLPERWANYDNKTEPGLWSIFIVRPLQYGGRYMFSRYKTIGQTCRFTLSTPYIGWLIWEECRKLSAVNRSRLFRALTSLPYGAEAARYMYERYVHEQFEIEGGLRVKLLTKKRDSPTLKLNMFPMHARQQTFLEISNIRERLRYVPELNPRYGSSYWRPHRPGICMTTFDSFALVAHRETPQLIIFQITIDRARIVSIEELRALHNQLPPDIRDIPPLIVFVTPEGNLGNIVAQNLSSDDGFWDKCEQATVSMGRELCFNS